MSATVLPEIRNRIGRHPRGPAVIYGPAGRALRPVKAKVAARYRSDLGVSPTVGESRYAA